MAGEGGGASSTIGTNFFLALFFEPGTVQVHMNIYGCRVWEVTQAKCLCYGLAEGVGFEPTRAFTLPVFKTGAINHSTTPPRIGRARIVPSARRPARPSGTQTFSLCGQRT